MKSLITKLQVLFATFGGYLGYFLGGFDGLLVALTTFVVVDYLTGVMVAIVQRKLSSEVGFRVGQQHLLFVV